MILTEGKSNLKSFVLQRVYSHWLPNPEFYLYLYMFFFKKLKSEYPGAIILKNDPTYILGIPDLTILWKKRWALLEVKDRKNAVRQRQQAYYIDLAYDMSYGAFIYPENELEVLDEIQRTFKPRR